MHVPMRSTRPAHGPRAVARSHSRPMCTMTQHARRATHGAVHTGACAIQAMRGGPRGIAPAAWDSAAAWHTRDVRPAPSGRRSTCRWLWARGVKPACVWDGEDDGDGRGEREETREMVWHARVVEVGALDSAAAAAAACRACARAMNAGGGTWRARRERETCSRMKHALACPNPLVLHLLRAQRISALAQTQKEAGRAGTTPTVDWGENDAGRSLEDIPSQFPEHARQYGLDGGDERNERKQEEGRPKFEVRFYVSLLNNTALRSDPPGKQQTTATPGHSTTCTAPMIPIFWVVDAAYLNSSSDDAGTCKWTFGEVQHAKFSPNMRMIPCSANYAAQVQPSQATLRETNDLRFYKSDAGICRVPPSAEIA
ncbi:hypothetical protein DFH06DRAFT_1306164 [Mycena polygramma]|nr:hypothetical protein DFH06DRAFT_1306164 [Mycena polygramma]